MSVELLSREYYLLSEAESKQGLPEEVQSPVTNVLEKLDQISTPDSVQGKTAYCFMHLHN